MVNVGHLREGMRADRSGNNLRVCHHSTLSREAQSGFFITDIHASKTTYTCTLILVSIMHMSIYL